MKLLPLYTPETFELVSGWLQQRENYQWLDFGAGRQVVTPTLLKIMAQRETNFMRVYTAHRDDVPIGIVALNNVDRIFRTGTLWGVAGEKSFSSRGYAGIAASRLLTLAFRDLGLHSVNTWVVDRNPSQRSVERIGFRPIGRQRQCHFIDGRPYDRLLFDLLASEHREVDSAGWRRFDKPKAESAGVTAP
ncbi:MAG TPA: GNAT family protein [Burkholderiales bacterium]|nr:GNAT family protein [Burkholderiales bacterium]